MSGQLSVSAFIRAGHCRHTNAGVIFQDPSSPPTPSGRAQLDILKYRPIGADAQFVIWKTNNPLSMRWTACITARALDKIHGCVQTVNFRQVIVFLFIFSQCWIICRLAWIHIVSLIQIQNTYIEQEPLQQASVLLLSLVCHTDVFEQKELHVSYGAPVRAAERWIPIFFAFTAGLRRESWIHQVLLSTNNASSGHNSTQLDVTSLTWSGSKGFWLIKQPPI